MKDLKAKRMEEIAAEKQEKAEMKKYLVELESGRQIYEMKIENYGQMMRSILKDQVSEE